MLKMSYCGRPVIGVRRGRATCDMRRASSDVKNLLKSHLLINRIMYFGIVS